MGKRSTELTRVARDLKLARVRPLEAHRQLVADGWRADQVSRAMWQAGYRDWDSMMSVPRVKKTIAVGGAVVVVGVLMGATLLFDSRRAAQTEVAGVSVLRDGTVELTEPDPQDWQEFADTASGVSFSYPVSWVVSDIATDSAVDEFAWQIEPERNEAIRAEIEKRYGDVLSDSSGPSPGALAILDDPLLSELVTITVLLRRAPTFEIEQSLDEWQELLEQAIGDSEGVSVRRVSDLQIHDTDAREFVTSISFGGAPIESREFIALMSDRRLEVSVFPADTSQGVLIQQIVDTIEFAPSL